MRLEPVNPPGDIYLQCCECLKMKPLKDIMADMDGKPFNAYYCKSCRKAWNAS